MIPHPWPALILALAVLRACRLAGWDTLPPLVAARDWLAGAETVTRGSTNAFLRQSADPLEETTSYRRPLIHELLTCAYCLGLWTSGFVYACWLLEPRWTLYGAVPLALSTVVGMAAHWLDP